MGNRELRTRLLQLLREHSLEIGRFTLTSGRRSSYYFDAKRTTLHPEGAYLCAKLMLEIIRTRGLEAEAVGGLSLGADPIVSALAAVSFAERRHYRPLQAFIARKRTKQHGTRRAIEGFRGAAGSPVIVVDDVCTTGGSTLQAVACAEDAGFEVRAVFCLVDRQQGGRQALADYDFQRLFTATELLDDPEIQRRLREVESLD